MIEIYKPELWDEFITLGLEMHKESSFKYITFDPEKIKKLVSQPNVLCILYKKDTQYIGFMLAHITPYYFSNTKAASDLALYVKPDHRGSPAAFKLIKVYEDWAKQNHIEDVYLAQSTGVEIEKTDSFFNRLGYTKLGSCVKKRMCHV